MILRPLRRRDANTRRPFFVLIRLRNPCTFLRLRTFGRNVGLIVKPLPTKKPYTLFFRAPL